MRYIKFRKYFLNINILYYDQNISNILYFKSYFLGVIFLKMIINSLKSKFKDVINSKYGKYLSKPKIITPFGIKPLDSILNGGLMSSNFVATFSTPETGKSTLALQFVSSFLNVHENGYVIYIDTEDTSGTNNTEEIPTELLKRIRNFKIDTERFIYQPINLDIQHFFEFISNLIEEKVSLENENNEEYELCIVLDSISELNCTKHDGAETPKEIIGYKAAELAHNVDKYKADISINRVTFYVIDQIRSAMSIKTKFQKADEKTVGNYNQIKMATASTKIQHKYRQLLFLSKGKILKPSEYHNINGHIIDAYVNKNKLSESGMSVPLVFDKTYGVLPLYTSYLFMQQATKSEKDLYTKSQKVKLIYPLNIVPVKNSKQIVIFDPNDPNEVLYTSKKFTEPKLERNYNTDIEFQYYFNKAVDIALDQRINVAYFNNKAKITKLTTFEEFLDKNNMTKAELQEKFDKINSNK